MAAEVMVLFGEKLVTCEGTLAPHGLPIPAVTLTERIGVPTFFSRTIPATC
jgi:hypothetical protein